MTDLIVPNIICFQTKKQLATLNNIQVLLKGVLTDLRARYFVYAKTFLHTRFIHTLHHACNLLSPVLCMMVSKLPGSLTERWNREVSKIRRHHRREPDLEDFIMYIEEETMLMSDPLFSWEALSELNTVKERSARRNKFKGFLTVSDGKAAADDKNSKKPPHCPLCNSSHDLDECRNFNEWK